MLAEIRKFSLSLLPASLYLSPTKSKVLPPKVQKALNHLRRHWPAYGLGLIFVTLFYWLNSRRYLTFQNPAPDADPFLQAIWNTTQGNFLYATIKEGSILQNHFTPIMAALSPLLLLWQDPRILYLVQLLGFAAAGLVLYKIVYDERPKLAFWFLLIFFLNPNLHTIAFFELRRVTLAVPFLALMAYALYKERPYLLLISTFLALLCKEEIGLIVFGLGAILLLKQQWKWGLFYVVLGASWFFLMLLVVIPAFGEGNYPPIGYFASWGDSLPAIVWSMVQQPGLVAQTMFDNESIPALWRLLLPTLLIVPLLGWEYFLIILPLLSVMLLATQSAMHRLGRWYMAALIPFVYAAVAIGLLRLRPRTANWLMGFVVVGTLLTFRLYSAAPAGRHFDPASIIVTERNQRTWQLLEQIPDDARVAAQLAFTSSLAFREQLDLYPWHGELFPGDYLIVAEESVSYPIPPGDLHWEILKLTTDPDLTIVAEVDGVYLFQFAGPEPPSLPINQVAEDSIKLEKLSLAVTDRNGFYQPIVPGQAPNLQAGQTIRVSLYWEAVGTPVGERTVSVRLSSSDGQIITQQDTQPAEASRPTSWWETGWYFRDNYYLTIPADNFAGVASLDLLLYDSYSAERIPFGELEQLKLFDLNILPQQSSITID